MHFFVSFSYRGAAVAVGIWGWCSASYALSIAQPPDIGSPGVVQPEKPYRPVLAYQVHAVRTAVVSGFDGKPWLRVSAKAFAPHGGYGKPRLVAKKQCLPDSLLRLRFLLNPPRQEDVAWPQALSEVEAIVLLPLAGFKRVEVRGHDGRGVRRINPDSPVFPRSWGAPPELQTKDWRPLPAKYGYGSSTLAHWIRNRLSRK